MVLKASEKNWQSRSVYTERPYTKTAINAAGSGKTAKGIHDSLKIKQI